MALNQKNNTKFFSSIFILNILLFAVFASEIEVAVDIEAPRRKILSNDHFVCVNFDWWPGDKYSKNPGAHYPWLNASVLNVDFKNPTLVSSLQALSPVYLRVGGSLADQITYDFSLDEDDQLIEPSSTSPCLEPTVNTSMTLGYNAGCIDGQRYGALHEFCRESKCKIVFGINGLYGRTPAPNTTELWKGEWNSSQAELLLTYTKAKGYTSTLAGVELGNEIDGAAGISAKLSPMEYAHDFIRLQRILADIWPANHSEFESDENISFERPLLIGPDSSGFSDSWWYPQFLNNMSEYHVSDSGIAIDVITWHLYLLGSGNSSQVPSEILNASYLNTLAPKCMKHHQTLETYPEKRFEKQFDAHTEHFGLREFSQKSKTKSSTHKMPQFWLGEGGGAYGSGQDGSTNTFLSTFWYGDSLGMLAAQGHDAFCRQALVGGNYALLQINNVSNAESHADSQKGKAENASYFDKHLEMHSITPNPDLYTAILWRQLMGDIVLNAYAGSNSSMTRFTQDNGGKSSDNVEADDEWSLGGNGTQGDIRTYAHCARQEQVAHDDVDSSGGALDVLGFIPPIGSLSMLLLNLGSVDYTVQLDSLSALQGSLVHDDGDYSTDNHKTFGHEDFQGNRYEWHLTSTSLDSHDMYLNDVKLILNDDGTLPLPLAPQEISDSVSQPLLLKATSAVFVLMPDLIAPACI